MMALASSPGLAICLNLQTTIHDEATSTPDCIPKKMSERDEDSDPKPMERPPSAPLYKMLAMLIAMAHCCRR